MSCLLCLLRSGWWRRSSRAKAADPEAGFANWRLLSPFPCPWNVLSAHCSHSGSRGFHRCSLEGLICYWDHLDLIRSPMKASVWTFNIPTSRSVTTHLAVTQEKTCKFPCLLHLPLTSLEWSGCFSPLLWPSLYGVSFRFHPWKVLRLWPHTLGVSQSSHVFHNLDTFEEPWTSVA